MGMIDEPPFVYSLIRVVPESDFAQGFDLGRDCDATVSQIRAAIESRQLLPPGIFDAPHEGNLIDFLCGDPLAELERRPCDYKTGMWICRGPSQSKITAKLPLIGLTQRALEGLLYLSSRLAIKPSGASERLDGALLFLLGFSMDHIESNLIPF